MEGTAASGFPFSGLASVPTDQLAAGSVRRFAPTLMYDKEPGICGRNVRKLSNMAVCMGDTDPNGKYVSSVIHGGNLAVS